MVNARTKDILRTIARTKSRFLSIFCIAALGVAFFAGVKATSPDMIESNDRYSDEQNLMHFRVLSTWGFDEDDVLALSQQEGVRVEPSYFYDTMTVSRGKELATRFLAYDDKESEMNTLVLRAGSFPEEEDECVVDESASVPIGSRITLTEEREDGDIIGPRQFVVVGKVRSAMYVSWVEHGNTTVGGGSVELIAYIPSRAFDSPVYTQVYLVYDDMVVPSAYTDVYDTLEKRHSEEIEQIAEVRTPERYATTVADAQRELEDGHRELADGEKQLQEARRELDDAKRRIEDGEKAVTDAEQTIRDNELALQEAEAELAAGQQELETRLYEMAELSVVLDDARIDYEEGYVQFFQQSREAERQLEEAARQIEEAERRLEEAGPALELANKAYSLARKMLDAARDSYAKLRARYEQAVQGQEDSELVAWLRERMEQSEALLDEVRAYFDEVGELLAEKQKEYDDGVAALEEAKAQYETAQAEYEAAMEEALAQLTDGKEQLDSGSSAFIAALRTVAAAQRTVNEARQQIEDGRARLEEGRKELNEKREELEQGKRDYEDGEQEYADRLAEWNDARRELEDAERTLRDLTQPEWLIYTRDDNDGYAEYGENAERIANIAKIFPVFFILVAMLVCINTMTRMVEEERTQLGTLKSLGYSGGAILAKYLIYCLSATLLGCVFGLAVGYKVFPFVIMKAYSMLYNISVQLMPFRLADGILITLVSVAVAAVTVVSCCARVLRENPAQLLRAKAPAGGKRVVLEHVPWLWRRMSFFRKVTARNLFRYKKRMVMTVIGITGCTALLLTGFGLSDSINDILHKQFGQVWHYSALTAVDGLTGENRQLIREAVRETGGEALDMLLLQRSFSCSANGTSHSAYVMAVESSEQTPDFITLKNRRSGKGYTLTDGSVIVTEKLARMLSISEGDTLTVRVDDTHTVDFPVAGVTENYVYNYFYMTPETYREMTGKEPDYNILLLRYGELDEETERELAKKVNAIEGVLTINLQSELYKNFSDALKSLNFVVMVLIASAALLAFVVLYNLANLNITERIREIATLEVLGFEDREISNYIFRESIVLTLMGTALGLGVGRVLVDYVVKTSEIDITMFGREVHPMSYILSIVLTLVFSLLVELYMHVPLRKISMVESLKSVD